MVAHKVTTERYTVSCTNSAEALRRELGEVPGDARLVDIEHEVFPGWGAGQVVAETVSLTFERTVS